MPDTPNLQLLEEGGLQHWVGRLPLGDLAKMDGPVPFLFAERYFHLFCSKCK